VLPDEKLEIGRRSNAGFSVSADTHLSRNHCIIEGGKSIFRIRDIGSVNGTFVNNSRVNVIELCDGDRIRVGNTLLEVRILDDQNPHEADGMHFSIQNQEPLEITDNDETVRQPKYSVPSQMPIRVSTVDI